MTDQTDHQNGTAEEVTDATTEEAQSPSSEPTEEPAEAVAPVESVEPAAESDEPAAVESVEPAVEPVEPPTEPADAPTESFEAVAEPVESASPPVEPAMDPAGEAARRRPTSLRGPDDPTAQVPHRKLTPAQFPTSPVFPGSTVRPPVSEPQDLGNSGHVSDPSSSLRNRLPNINVAVDHEAVEQLRSQIRQRPEMGLGLAFAGGLVIATILKRLGR